MIRRPEGESWLLITQPDHAALAGTLARAWRGGPAPDPLEETLLAIAEHDNGWREWEAAPTVNEHGEPRHFSEMAIADHLAIWERGIARLASISPYAALLVSSHADSLFRRRLDPPRDSPAARRLVAAFRRRQGRLRRSLVATVAADRDHCHGLAPPRLAANLQLLQLCDYLSLRICCAAPQSPATVRFPALAAPPGDGTFRYCRLDATTAALAPFPFGTEPLAASVRAVRLRRAPFPSDEAFRAALAAAPTEALDLRLVPGE